MGLGKKDSCFGPNATEKTCLKFYDANELADGSDIESGI